MLYVKKMLFSTGLLDELSTTPSIACISTSRPIYLVFDQKSEYPVYVVRNMDDPTALYSHKVHDHLYRLVYDLVPEPIGVYEFSGKEYDIQKGVEGSPWFQLKSKIRTAEERARLEKRMWQTLCDFQAGIYAGSTSEACQLKPHEELLKAYSLYQDAGEVPSIELKKIIEQAVKDLLLFPDCLSIPQHGDFCLNNLIIDTDHITVIDFEDFDITQMPMYDHFTLALSLPSLGEEPKDAASVFANANIIMEANLLDIPNNLINWHFLHHLLLRLGPWSTGEKRKPYRYWLKQVLDCFLEDQGKGLV